MEGDRRQKNFGFASEATRGMSDQIWGSPTLAKSRIWELVVHRWKISSQTSTFIFFHKC